MKLSRKEFLAGTFGVVVGGLSLQACDGGDGGGGDGGQDGTDSGQQAANCNENGAGTVIDNNHGHVMVVSAADVQAGVAKTYDIQGQATHPHTVSLSAGDFAQLATNQTITVNSSLNGHDHLVQVICS